MSEGSRIRSFMARALPGQVSQVTRGLALRALVGVVMRTPVDTGRARGGWSTSLGGATGRDTGVLDRSGSAPIAQGTATIGQHKGYEQIVLENNVPYIGKLDEGSSQQAPDGMTELTLADLGLSPGRD